MNNRLYVGNLSYSATSESVRNCFTACGEVTDVHVVMDRETGASRGFAFVTMAREADAQSAIAELQGFLLDGRPLRVNEAEERGKVRAAPPRDAFDVDSNRNHRGGHRGW